MITARPSSLPQDKRLTKGERTRAQLLEVAAAEFAERGFQHTRISDIVARAGVTQPVFYQYFAGKQAAYDELVGLFAQRLRQAIGQARMPDGLQDAGLDSRVRLGVSGLLAILQEDPNLTRIGFFQAAEAEALKNELAAMIADNVRAEQKVVRPIHDGHHRTVHAAGAGCGQAASPGGSRHQPVAGRDTKTAPTSLLAGGFFLAGIRIRIRA
jgi:AcrR family transcriptional regulator